VLRPSSSIPNGTSMPSSVRHNVPGGWAEIETATAGGRAVVRVRNTGPVIPAAEVDRLFQPFQRFGNERVRHGLGGALNNGHGLGLAIVGAIAAAHDAELTASPRPEGGLDITVRFPVLAK
jgi:signal transduction histidine kinase